MAEKKTSPPTRKVLPAKPGAAPAKPAKGAAKEDEPGGVGSWVERSAQFLREVKTELKKVTWPSRKQTMASTGVVLGLVVLISVFLGLVDVALSHFVRFLIG